MLVRVMDPSDENYRSEEVQKVYSGVRNNLPHLLPFTGISKRDKRRALRQKGLEKPLNMLVDDISMVGIPAEIDEPVHRYARKIGAALYYREKGKPIGKDFVFWTHWAQAVDKVQMEGILQVAGMSPFRTIGNRPNMKFGNRFAYKCDKSDNNDLFTAVVQFGSGLVLVILVADGESAKQLADEEGWVPASAMFA